MTRSEGLSPERITRSPSRRSPIWTCFGVTTLFDPTVRTIWSDWSGSTEASGTSSVGAGGETIDADASETTWSQETVGIRNGRARMDCAA